MTSRSLPFLLGALGVLGGLFLAATTHAADGDLNARMDGVIKKIHARELRSDTNTPWVVMHAVIAYEKDMTVTDAESGKKVNAIEYLLTQARHDGKRIWRNDKGEPALPTRGLSFGMRQSFLIQDHVDQFLMAFADAGVPLKLQLVADDGKTFTLQDKLAASKRNLKDNQEVGWTLVAFTTYLSFDDKWEAKDGKTYTIADIAQIAVKRDTNRETEGGPHHLYGVAYALNKWRQQGGKVEGVWDEARQYLDKHAALAKRYQQKDGSFSVGMFRGSRLAATPKHLVWATGHTLEWLSVALTPDQLREPWVVRGVKRLVEVLEKHPTSIISDGSLYHAAHALRLYKAATTGKK